jgi:hypothetical protein
MNDESQKLYYESAEHKAPESVIVIKKVLEWLSISDEKGISDPVFINSGLAVNKAV